MRLAIFLAVLLLAACCPVRVVTKPVPVTRDVVRIEPVPDVLTAPHAVAEGALADCPVVAAQRKAELQACNGDKAAIRARHGGER
jgi:hypothetical protein